MPLLEFVAELERVLGREAVKDYRPMQPGDVEATAAETGDLKAAVGFAPRTPLAEGLQKFVDWYRDFYASTG